MDAPIEIVGGEAIEDLAELEGVAEAIFGAGRREPGWFARKLAREGVRPQLSALARDDAGRVRGYALLGRAPSLGATARGAGVGLIPALRGRGLGPRLLELARARARAAGCEALEFLATPAGLPWYERQGFQAVREELCLSAPALGDAPVPARVGDDAPLGEAALWSWVPEFWRRTPSDERGVLELDGLRAWWSREGRARLIHRVELREASRRDPASLRAQLDALRRAFARNTPVLLYPCASGQGWVEALLTGPWAPAQRSFVVRRSTTE